MSKIVYINKHIGTMCILEIFEANEDIETIQCPKSIYNRISKQNMNALKELGISVEIAYKDTTKGHEKDQIVINLANQGISVPEIAKKCEISTHKVYRILRNSNCSSKKYSKKNDYDAVKKLHNQGLKAKEIAEQLDMPLRSVYYALKKK